MLSLAGGRIFEHITNEFTRRGYYLPRKYFSPHIMVSRKSVGDCSFSVLGKGKHLRLRSRHIMRRAERILEVGDDDLPPDAIG